MDGINIKINEGITVTILFLLIFFVSKALYDDHLLNKYLLDFKQKNEELRIQNSIQEGDLKYYETEQYKDLYAKENLNLLRGGEKVMILKAINPDGDIISKSFGKDKLIQKVENLKVLNQWIIYFNLQDILRNY